MNYFPFHLGDYAAHTAHLEPMEDLAYRRLLDQYYLKEGPLPADIQVTAKLVRMRSMATDVESVLKEFFTLTEKGWTHSRCDSEIAHMQDKQTKARASAAASVKSRQAFADKKTKTHQTSADETSNGRSTSAQINPADVQLPTPTPTPTPISSVTDVTAIGDGETQAELTKVELWAAGKSILAEQGMPKAQCGSFVGKLVKDFGDEVVVDAVRAAVVQRPADVAQYLVATCQNANGVRKPVNKQEALEARNRAVADAWCKEMESKMGANLEAV